MDDSVEPPAEAGKQQPNRAVIAIKGDLDVASFTQLRRHLTECFSEGCFDITIDLSRMTFIDSAGIGVIVGAMRQIKSHDGRLTLTQPSAAVRKVLDITGLAAQAEIIDEMSPRID